MNDEHAHGSSMNDSELVGHPHLADDSINTYGASQKTTPLTSEIHQNRNTVYTEKPQYDQLVDHNKINLENKWEKIKRYSANTHQKRNRSRSRSGNRKKEPKTEDVQREAQYEAIHLEKDNPFLQAEEIKTRELPK